MGLDTVELVMAIEDEFKISIPNAIAGRLVRLRDFQDFAVSALRDRGEQVDPAAVWERLKRVAIAQCAFREDQVVPGAHLVYDLGLD